MKGRVATQLTARSLLIIDRALRLGMQGEPFRPAAADEGSPYRLTSYPKGRLRRCRQLSPAALGISPQHSLVLSLSKDERFGWWFDKPVLSEPLILRQAQDER